MFTITITNKSLIDEGDIIGSIKKINADIHKTYNEHVKIDSQELMSIAIINNINCPLIPDLSFIPKSVTSLVLIENRYFFNLDMPDKDIMELSKSYIDANTKSCLQLENLVMHCMKYPPLDIDKLTYIISLTTSFKLISKLPKLEDLTLVAIVDKKKKMIESHKLIPWILSSVDIPDIPIKPKHGITFINFSSSQILSLDLSGIQIVSVVNFKERNENPFYIIGDIGQAYYHGCVVEAEKTTNIKEMDSREPFLMIWKMYYA